MIGRGVFCSKRYKINRPIVKSTVKECMKLIMLGFEG